MRPVCIAGKGFARRRDVCISPPLAALCGRCASLGKGSPAAAMCASAIVPGRRVALGERSSGRSVWTSARLEAHTRGVKPNPPYLATIVIAVVLMVIGLSLEGSLISVASLNQVVGDLLATVGIKAREELARLMIIASPTLLIIGSLVPGI